MRIVDFGEELDDVAVSRSESGRRPLSDTVEPQDRGALEGRWVKTDNVPALSRVVESIIVSHHAARQ